MAKISYFLFMVAFAAGAQSVSSTPSKYPDQDVTGYHESSGEALVDMLVEEKSHLLISNSTMSWIKNCVCSILSTGGCGIYLEKRQIAEALNKNHDWNDFSSVLKKIEKTTKDNGPDDVSNFYKSTLLLDKSVMNPTDIVRYLGNIIKKCFYNS